MKITLQMLKDHDACQSKIALFVQNAGGSVVVTEQACLDLALILKPHDWHWAAANLLPKSAGKIYAEEFWEVWKAYSKACAAAFAKAAAAEAQGDA